MLSHLAAERLCLLLGARVLELLLKMIARNTPLKYVRRVASTEIVFIPNFIPYLYRNLPFF